MSFTTEENDVMTVEEHDDPNFSHSHLRRRAAPQYASWHSQPDPDDLDQHRDDRALPDVLLDEVEGEQDDPDDPPMSLKEINQNKYGVGFKRFK